MLLKNLMERFFGWKVILEIPESKITVVKRKDDRILLSTNIIYSKLRDNSIYTHSYWDYFLPLAALHERSNVLVLGLSGGTIPYQMNKTFGSRVSIDAVEIDSNMIRAMKVFLPGKLNANVVLGDGYDYINRTKKKYDLIVFDIFKGLDIPGKFIKRDFIDKVYSAMKPDGVLAVNYVFRHSGMKRFGFRRRLKKRFKMYTISEPRLFGNKIFICSKRLSKEQIISRMESSFPKNEENSFILEGYKRMA